MESLETSESTVTEESEDPNSPKHDSSDVEARNDKHKESLSHPVALQRAREHIERLLADPFLQDLPADITLDELKSKLALEQGKAITLHLRRYDDEILPIIVLQGATVQELKKAIENETTRRCRREGRTAHLSWRYVWGTYWLAHGQQRLEDPQAKLTSLGISNHSEVTFVKKLRHEHKGRRNRRNY